jgi:hypothetical protein
VIAKMQSDGKESKRDTNRFFVSLSYEDKYRRELYYSLIESILVELNDRFSSKNMEVLNRLSALVQIARVFHKLKY